jgi:hypothetical protein
MLKSALSGPGFPSSTTISTNAESDILNILGRGPKYDGRSHLSGIVCSVASMSLLSFASALMGDSCHIRQHHHSALFSTEESGTSTLIGSRSD